MKIKIQATHPAELSRSRATSARAIEMEVEAEMIGDVLVYQSPTSKYWIAKNQKTGFTTNNAEKSRAVADAWGESFAKIKI